MSHALRTQARIPGLPAAYSGVSGTDGIATWDCPVGPRAVWGPRVLPALSQGPGVRTCLSAAPWAEQSERVSGCRVPAPDAELSPPRGAAGCLEGDLSSLGQRSGMSAGPGIPWKPRPGLGNSMFPVKAAMAVAFTETAAAAGRGAPRPAPAEGGGQEEGPGGEGTPGQASGHSGARGDQGSKRLLGPPPVPPGDPCLLPSPSPPSPSPWTLGLRAAGHGEDGGPGQFAQRCSSRQELQQKRAQKAGGPEFGLLKEARETEKPRPAQEPPPRPGGTTHAQQTHKANNAGEPPAPALRTLKGITQPEPRTDTPAPSPWECCGLC